MSTEGRLTQKERTEIEELISSFDDHGCGLGLDIKAQAALRRLLSALDDAEHAVNRYRVMSTGAGGSGRSGEADSRGPRDR